MSKQYWLTLFTMITLFVLIGVPLLLGLFINSYYYSIYVITFPVCLILCVLGIHVNRR